MTERQLFNLKQLIRDARHGDGGLTNEEIDDLQQVVADNLHYAQVNEFIQHIDNAMPEDLPNATEEQQQQYDESWEPFYELDWAITFNGKTLIIGNEAVIYNAVLSALQEYREAYSE